MSRQSRLVPALAFVSIAVLLSAAAAAPAEAAKKPSAGSPKGSLKALNSLQALEPRALRRWPESFGGLWLEGERVFVAFTGRAMRRVDRLAARYRGPKKLRAVTVDDSLASLEGLQDRMVADRHTNPVLGTDPASGRPVRLSYDLDIEVKRNIVVAIVDRPVTPELAAAFGNRYGEDVVVERGPLTGPEGLFACLSRDNCPPTLRAGLLADDPFATCSTAFTVSYPSGAGTANGVLSAAHCGSASGDDYLGDRFHAGTQYGEVVAEQQSGRLDVEIHSVVGSISPDTVWGAKAPWIYVSDAAKKGVVGQVGTYQGLPIGLGICKSGYVTGTTCGQVESKWYTPGDYIINGEHFVRASYCSNPGDSGAGVHRAYFIKGEQDPKQKRGISLSKRYEAQGVHSGGPVDPETEEPLLCGHPDDFGIFGHIEFVEDFYSLEVNKDSP